MKKIIIICLLAFTILAGGMTMEAKTTKKKAKAKTSQGSTSAVDGASKLNYETFFYNSGGKIDFKNLLEIESALNKAGFKMKSSSDSWKYTCNGTTVSISGDGDFVFIDINFKDKKSLEAFVAKMVDSGFKYEITTRSGIKYYSKGGIEMSVDIKGKEFINVSFEKN